MVDVCESGNVVQMGGRMALGQVPPSQQRHVQAWLYVQSGTEESEKSRCQNKTNLHCVCFSSLSPSPLSQDTQPTIMAKGLRCKSALKHRNIKREAVFGPVEAARVQRLAERLKKDAEGLKTSELEAIARGEELMQVEKSKGSSPPLDNTMYLPSILTHTRHPYCTCTRTFFN